MYIILGSDQKEYGPITEEQLCQWIAQRRANPETLVRLENASEWKPLSTFPEFSAALTAVAPGPPALGARPAGVVPVAPKTSGLAVASLVLGMVGFCTVGLTSLIGLVLGLVSLSQIKKSKGQLGGRGLGIAGICLSIVSILFGVVVLAVILAPVMAVTLPAIAKAKTNAQTLPCVSNLKQISLAARLYASDHQETFPLAATWCDALQPELGGAAAKVFKCNADISSQRCSYGYNLQLSGKKESEVNPQTVMFFEIDGGWNVSGGPELLMKTGRHGQIINVGFVNGTVQQLPASAIFSLRWNP